MLRFSTTRFRWVQQDPSNAELPDWAIDDVYIGEACPQQCHGRGDCVHGKCVCDPTYVGELVCIKIYSFFRNVNPLQDCLLVAYMLSLPDSPGDSRNLVKSPDLPGGRMNLPDFYHIEIRLKSTLMAENPYKTSPFSM